MPGRKFPGVVVQGDSLNILLGLANSILDRAMATGNTELVDDAQELRQLLAGRLRYYEATLQRHGIELPYVPRVNKNAQGDFMGYVGSAFVHDAIIKHVEQTNDTVTVELQTCEKKLVAIRFTGVKSVISNKPEGMVLYALSEMFYEVELLRRFVFVNSDEENDSALEIIATDFVIQEIE